MKISSFKIFIVFIILTLLGVFIIPKLSVKLNPNATLPSITVSYNWTNASPYTVEQKVTSQLEAGFNTLKGLQQLESKSSKGSGYITLEFDKYTDIDFARFEIATIIRQLYNQLPQQLSYPVIYTNRPDSNENQAFLSYSINAKTTPFIIQETVKTQLEPLINAIPSIDKTQVYGANPKEIIITYNNDILASLHISKKEIIDALQRSFKKIPLGNTRFNQQYITLAIHPSNTTLNWHIPVKKVTQRIIFLDELVTIKEAAQETQRYYRINGRNAINLAIYASKNANTISLAKSIDKKLEEILKKLPVGYEIIKTYDSTEYLKTELQKIFERTIYTVLILLVFILLVSRSIRYLWITLLSLVANIGTAFLFYYFFGIEIQLYSLAGITISLGLIIDNSIVMIDHIMHQHNKQVFISIFASTLTTIGALGIIYFLDDSYKINLIDFSYVIIINLSVSLLVALFLIPALLEKILLKTTTSKQEKRRFREQFYSLYTKLLKILLRYKRLAITFIILLFGIPFFLLPQKLENNNTLLEKTYNKTLGNSWYRENVRPYIDTYLGGSLRLFNYYVFENAYYSKNEETKLLVTASMEKGTTVHQMNEAFIVIENYLQQFIEIKQYTATIYSGSFARIEITFKDAYKDASFPVILKNRLIHKALDLGGMEWSISGVGKGFSNGQGVNDLINFSIEAKGYNYDVLNAWADTLKYALKKHPRVQKVIVRENSFWAKKASFEYRFNLDKEKLALIKYTPSKIINELKKRTLSKYPDLSLNIDGNYLPIRFESVSSKKFDIWHVKNMPLDSLKHPLLLKDIATITKQREEENIYKINQEYIRLVEFQYTGSSKFGAKFLNKKLAELKAKLPLGYSFERTERKWFLNHDKNNNYAFLMLLVLGVIYFICAILFESFKQPFIILSIIPISFIGVFLTFYLFDFNFDQGGMASFVLLSGITVNASIFIVNGFNSLKKKHPKEASIALYIKAFQQKIFPILLTTVSTILGFIPFIKDGQNEVFWFALGIGTIGGLLFSLIGIIFYLPLFTLKRNLLNKKR